ncbi:hypothetical protein GX586_04880 [bacterium]|nr:hypothetical protein [bacterium]
MSRAHFTLLMVATAIVVGILCTYASAYITCETAFSKVTRAKEQLYAECDALAELVTPVSALALLVSPEHTNTADRARLAKERMLERRSAADMARAYMVLRSSMQTLVVSLDNAARTADIPQHTDYRRSLVTQFRRTDAAAEAYNNAVRTYHKAMAGEVESFWNRVMQYKPGEEFGVARAPAAPARTTNAPRRAAPAAGAEPSW